MLKHAFALLPLFILPWLVVSGCSSPGSVTYTTTPSTSAALSTLGEATNQAISGGGLLELPSGGVAAKSGQSLTLSWSADGTVQGVILSSKEYDQYKSFKQSGKTGAPPTEYKQGTVTKYVTTDDTYFGLIINNSSSSVKLASATLKGR